MPQPDFHTRNPRSSPVKDHWCLCLLLESLEFVPNPGWSPLLCPSLLLAYLKPVKPRNLERKGSSDTVQTRILFFNFHLELICVAQTGLELIGSVGLCLVGAEIKDSTSAKNSIIDKNFCPKWSSLDLLTQRTLLCHFLGSVMKK